MNLGLVLKISISREIHRLSLNTLVFHQGAPPWNIGQFLSHLFSITIINIISKFIYSIDSKIKRVARHWIVDVVYTSNISTKQARLWSHKLRRYTCIHIPFSASFFSLWADPVLRIYWIWYPKIKNKGKDHILMSVTLTISWNSLTYSVL